MQLLKETAPDLYCEFQNGKHVVTRSSHSSFNSVWSDLGLEQSVVKETKSRQGGIIGFSRVQEATIKWYLTVHERSGILRNFKAMCGLSKEEDQGHRDLKKANTKKDESEIRQIQDTGNFRQIWRSIFYQWTNTKGRRNARSLDKHIYSGCGTD